MGADFLNSGLMNTLGDIQTLGDNGIGGLQTRVRERGNHQANIQLGQQLYTDLANFKDHEGKPLPDADLAALKHAADTGQVQELTAKSNYLFSKQNQELQRQQREQLSGAVDKFAKENPGAFPGSQSDLLKAFTNINPAAGATFAEHGLNQQKQSQKGALQDQINETNSQIAGLPKVDTKGKKQASVLKALTDNGGKVELLSPDEQKVAKGLQDSAESKLNEQNQTLENPVGHAIMHPIDFVSKGFTLPTQIKGNDKIKALMEGDPRLKEHLQTEASRQSLQQQKQQLQQQKQQVDLGKFKPAGAQAKTLRIQASDGSFHDIPANKLNDAKKLDPKLKVQ